MSAAWVPGCVLFTMGCHPWVSAVLYPRESIIALMNINLAPHPRAEPAQFVMLLLLLIAVFCDLTMA